jgi:RNA recognition motif-containing protein
MVHPQLTTLFLGDLSTDIVAQDLIDLISPVAVPFSLVVKRNNQYAFAFARFENDIDAKLVLEQFNHTEIKGKTCRIMIAENDLRGIKSGVGNVFVKNLDKDVDSRKLWEAFSAYGNIKSCKVGMDANGKLLNYGFVHFQDPKVADRVIREVNGKDLPGIGSLLKVEKYEAKKNERVEGEKSGEQYYESYKTAPANLKRANVLNLKIPAPSTPFPIQSDDEDDFMEDNEQYENTQSSEVFEDSFVKLDSFQVKEAKAQYPIFFDASKVLARHDTLESEKPENGHKKAVSMNLADRKYKDRNEAEKLKSHAKSRSLALNPSVPEFAPSGSSTAKEADISKHEIVQNAADKNEEQDESKASVVTKSALKEKISEVVSKDKKQTESKDKSKGNVQDNNRSKNSAEPSATFNPSVKEYVPVSLQSDERSKSLDPYVKPFVPKTEDPYGFVPESNEEPEALPTKKDAASPEPPRPQSTTSKSPVRSISSSRSSSATKQQRVWKQKDKSSSSSPAPKASKKSFLIDQEEMDIIHGRLFTTLRKLAPFSCGRLMVQMLCQYSRYELLEFLDNPSQLSKQVLQLIISQQQS